MTQRLLGPTGGRRRRWWYAGATLVAAAVFVVFFVASSGAVTGSPSNFESDDGNMVLNASGDTDWNCFQGTDAFATLASGTPVGCAVTTGAIHVTADAAGEITWKNGQKFDTQCPVLQTGSVPNKDDFTDIAEYQEFAANGDLYFYGGAIRQTANGNASGDVEFNQASGNGTTSAGCRTAGDLLIAYNFLNGGTSLEFFVLTWIDPTNLTAGGNNGTCFVKQDSPNPNGCWGANAIKVQPVDFDGQANQSPIAAADNGISGTALAAQQFSEFGINLTHALGGALPCFPQQVWESRSSGSSFTSNPEDIEFVHLATCGALKVHKTAKNKTLGSGDQPQSGVTFTVTNSSGTTVATLITGTDGTDCTEALAPGSGYTVTETVPSGYSADTPSQPATVTAGSTCDSATALEFHNTPLTTITVSTTSLAGAGVTDSTVQCTGESAASPTPHTTTGLVPGSYTCTVVIDP
jgi:Prealbumin-like fold domain